MADSLAEPQWLSLAKKSKNHTATRVWLTTDATRRIHAQTAKAALVDGNQVVPTGRKSNRAVRSSNGWKRSPTTNIANDLSTLKEKTMPHVIVKLWPGKSEQQKTRLAKKTLRT
jgi:hypothetical protein